MIKPIEVELTINKQGADRDLRLYARIRTPEDVLTVQNAVDSFLYDLLNDIRAAQEEAKP